MSCGLSASVTPLHRLEVVRVRKDLFKGVVLGAAVSIVVLVSSSAFAGAGIGAPFNLGRINSVDAKSILQGDVDGPNLQVRNSGVGPGLGSSWRRGNRRSR